MQIWCRFNQYSVSIRMKCNVAYKMCTQIKKPKKNQNPELRDSKKPFTTIRCTRFFQKKVSVRGSQRWKITNHKFRNFMGCNNPCAIGRVKNGDGRCFNQGDVCLLPDVHPNWQISPSFVCGMNTNVAADLRSCLFRGITTNVINRELTTVGHGT